MSKKNKVPGLVTVIFAKKGKSRNRHQALGEIIDSLFGQNSSVKKRHSIFQQLIDQITIICGQQGYQTIKERAEIFFQQLASKSVEQGDLTMLQMTLVPGKNCPKKKVPVCRFAAVAYFRVVGSDFRHTKRFCQLLFAGIKKTLEELALLVPGEESSSAMNYLFFIAHVFTQSSGAPILNDYPQKKWLLNLIHAFDEGDEAVNNWLRGVLDFISRHNRMLKTIIQHEKAGSRVDSLVDKLNQPYDFDHPYIVISSNEMDKLAKAIKITRIQNSLRKDKAEEFHRWYFSGNNRVLLQQAMQKMKTEIRNNPRSALLAHGRDGVEVGLSQLRYIGITCVHFYPEGCQFPDVKLKIKVQKDFYVYCEYWAELNDLSLEAGDHIFDNYIENDYGYLRELLHFTVISVMHMIVVGNDNIHSSEESVKRPSNCYINDSGTLVTVRARFRNLHPGWKASDNARMLAYDNQGWTLPYGKTYVREHERPSTKGIEQVQVKPIVISDNTLADLL